MDAIHSYRVYFLSAADHIRSVTLLSAIDDASACMDADVLLRQSEHAAVEVWDERRLVCHMDRAQQVA